MCRYWLALASLLSLGACAGDELCTPAGVQAGEDAIVNGRCAPEGELFEDHFDCSRVAGPCPGASGEAEARVAEDPARQDDADLEWSREQIGSCTCSCCHQQGGVADHKWAWDFSPAWSDSAKDEALRHLLKPGEDAGERPHGASNNGFGMLSTGLPTTDPERFRAFVERELERRVQ